MHILMHTFRDVMERNRGVVSFFKVFMVYPTQIDFRIYFGGGSLMF